MFLRQKRNKSGSISVQIITKNGGRYKVLKTLGSSSEEQGIAMLLQQGRNEIKRLEAQTSLFISQEDVLVESYVSNLANSQIKTIGPELVYGKIYDYIGYQQVKEDLFRHLVISRLAFPLSKLKTIEYLYRYQGLKLKLDNVYRFLDRLNEKHKSIVELISFNHTKKVLEGQLSIVFYDMTTLYFESSDEDDLRKAGFSKDGKHSNPQIFLGLLVGLGGYAIGYDIFEGDIFEGHTLIPMIEKLTKKFELTKPIIVADAGLLSKNNVEFLENNGYEYILGARIKNESVSIKNQVLQYNFVNQEYLTLEKESSKLIVQYSEKRAKKDFHNREKGLKRLEKRIASGKLTKANINNRGYNKYLKMTGEIEITIDQDKFNQDQSWDGLKGYLTNCKQEPKIIIENYKNLWQIEKAFRMSKTDLRIRPIYHRLARRIEAHICISFVAYSIYKELERVIKAENFPLSVEKAAEITHNMYQMEITLPESRQTKKILLKMDNQQNELIKIIEKYF